MLISLPKRLVFFSMPKSGSSAIQSALGRQFGAVFAGPPELKHLPFRLYKAHVLPMLAAFTDEPVETVCLFREPLDWHRSWWRYRMRDKSLKTGRSTRGMSFPEFIEGNLRRDDIVTRTGRQANFVSDPDGGVGVTHLFRYERIAACHAFLCERLGVEAPLERVNVTSAKLEAEAPDAALMARYRARYAREYRIYETMAR